MDYGYALTLLTILCLTGMFIVAMLLARNPKQLAEFGRALRLLLERLLL
jgi:hypothetical protein